MAIMLDDGNFEKEVMEAEIPVLVDFYADWCGPCKMMASVVEELAKEYDGKVKVGKLDVDASPASPAKFGVLSIPTFLLVKSGKVVDTVVGALSKKELMAKVDAII